LAVEFSRYYKTGELMEEGFLNTNNTKSFKKTRPIEQCEDLNLFSAWQLNFTNGTNYSVFNEDGSIKVDNKGYNYKTKEWEQAIGKAKFVDDQNVGMLKVSFFGPFYSGYNVIALDDSYQYVLIAGKNLDYIWILAREKTIPDSIRKNYLDLAGKLGYNTADLIWVEHDK
jgi:apolipoprotein D and lipocalin family protein